MTKYAIGGPGGESALSGGPGCSNTLSDRDNGVDVTKLPFYNKKLLKHLFKKYGPKPNFLELLKAFDKTP